ncbi:MAG: type III-A CRISPR-associated RAMP protein Csm3 [Acetobacteraceae bacterium]|nr:type III-A CRISPR-associated RAMP protein Csm3 [Acetobacteraceae bacterium]
MLVRHCVLRGRLRCITGLRIGGSKEDIEIGGQENPIIRHPITRLPYVPGSSLKGRMRILLELKSRPNVRQTGKPCDCGACDICRVFGAGDARRVSSPTRLLVRDANLTPESRSWLEKAFQEKGVYYAESKTEVLIDRVTGVAHGSVGPRTQERVPAGTEFDLELVLRVFEGDDLKKDKALIEEGLRLVQRDALGGSGSRGYGKVEFLDLRWDDEEREVSL